MATELSTADYAVLGVFLAAMMAVGVWAGRRTTTTDEFFLADRSLSWWPLGLSLAVTCTLAIYYCRAPNEAYWAGWKFLLAPALIWATLPLVFWCVIPLCAAVKFDSIYEYLELRYGPATRATAAAVYVAGMLLWLGGVLVLPCKALQLGTAAQVPTLPLLIGVGAVVTLYTYLGGMKATVFTDVIQVALMAAALLVLMFLLAGNLKEGAGLARIGEVARELGRTSVAGPMPQWSGEWTQWAAQWSIWAAVPYLVLLPMFFFVADQATLARLFAAGDGRSMKLCWLLGCGVFTLLVPAAMYVGMGLLAVYHDNAQAELPPQWVANGAVDADTVIDAENIERLIAERVVLDPNTNLPLDDTEGLVNARGQVVIDRLATRATRMRGGERRLRAGGDRLFAHFVKRHLHFGLAGVVLAALLAAVMATIDSGLNALATLIVIDFHRRFGWAEMWLARQSGKPPEQLDQGDELKLARPVVLGLGGGVVAISLVVAGFDHVVGYLLSVLNVFAGPLLGIFLLGLLTRRTTAAAALTAMVLGIAVALWLTLGHHLMGHTALAPAWPFAGPLGPFRPFLLGLGATLVAGPLLSFLVGTRKSREELTGLVVGLGPLGILLEIEDEAEEDEVYWIETEGDDGPRQGPWS